MRNRMCLSPSPPVAVMHATVQAVRQGVDLPWWQKLLGARFKDGKFQLARLQVCAPLLFLPVLHAWGLYMRLIYAVCMECSNW